VRTSRAILPEIKNACSTDADANANANGVGRINAAKLKYLHDFYLHEVKTQVRLLHYTPLPRD